jgi:hypothetical protein
MAKRTVRHALFSYMHPKLGWQVAFRGEEIDVTGDELARGEKNEAFLPAGKTQLPTAPGSVGRFPSMSPEEQTAWAHAASPEEIVDEAQQDPSLIPQLLAAEKAARKGKVRKSVQEGLDLIVAERDSGPGPVVGPDGEILDPLNVGD